jgi:hypothetical protein
MEHGNTIEQLVTGSPWRCIPVFVSAPAALEAQFFADGTGLTTYERQGGGRGIPDFWDIEWAWRWSESTPGLLNITWSADVTAGIEFEIVDVSDTFYNRDNEPTTFVSKLTVSTHLFTLGGDFPDGWPREYFSDGKTHGSN